MPLPVMDNNQFGTVSKLYITVQKAASSGAGGPQTILSDCYFTAPFKVMKPFPRADGGLMIYQQTASAGIMAGDTQDHRFIVKEYAILELISQSFEKLFKMDSGSTATRSITAFIDRNALLYYTPLPCIPFGGSDFSTKSEIKLADGTSRLLYEDCICCGRKGHGENFAYRQYRNLIEVFRAEKLIYRDNTVFTGSDSGKYPERLQFMQSSAMYGPYSHLGTLLLFGFGKTPAEISALLGLPDKYLYTRDRTPENVLAGVTQTAHGDIVVRALGNSAEQIQLFFAGLKSGLSG